MALDLDGTIKGFHALTSELEKLVRLATDTRTPIEERRNAALAACEGLARSGALELVGKTRAFLEKNRVHLDRARHAAGLLDSFRGRK
jgi:hypothetical protein